MPPSAPTLDPFVLVLRALHLDWALDPLLCLAACCQVCVIAADYRCELHIIALSCGWCTCILCVALAVLPPTAVHHYGILGVYSKKSHEVELQQARNPVQRSWSTRI